VNSEGNFSDVKNMYRGLPWEGFSAPQC